MRFGIIDHNDDTGRPHVQQVAERLELIEAYDRLGFYAYHLTEHHGTPLAVTPSPHLMLAAAAQRTSRLRLGTLITILSLYHPMRVIEEAVHAGPAVRRAARPGRGPRRLAGRDWRSTACRGGGGAGPVRRGLRDPAAGAVTLGQRDLRREVLQARERAGRLAAGAAAAPAAVVRHPDAGEGAMVRAARHADDGAGAVAGRAGADRRLPGRVGVARAAPRPTCRRWASPGTWCSRRPARRRWRSPTGPSPRFRDSLYFLWKKYGIPTPPVFPAETFEGIHATGHFYAGDPAGARDWVAPPPRRRRDQLHGAGNVLRRHDLRRGAAIGGAPGHRGDAALRLIPRRRPRLPTGPEGGRHGLLAKRYFST